MHGNMPRYQAWTDESDALLRKLRGDGLSASVIGMQIGRSRNSVIGRMHRLGISSPNAVDRKPREPRLKAERNGGAVIQSIKARGAAARSRGFAERKIAARTNDTRARNAVIARAVAMGELPKCEAVELPPEPSDRPRVSLLELQHGQCKFPLGEVGNPDFGFCAAPAITDREGNTKPYCAHHHARCHQ